MALAVVGAVALSTAAASQELVPNQASLPAPQNVTATMVAEPAASAGPDAPKSVLPAGTPVIVMLNQELSTVSSNVGDRFEVTVLHDVMQDGAVIIPKGSIGHGEVTFSTNKGAFGKPGILGIAMRHLDYGDRKIILDGRYREEGGNNNAATAATWVAVGIFSGFIKGKAGVIPQGRELKARLGEDIAFVPGSTPATPPAAVEPVAEVVPPAAGPA